MTPVEVVEGTTPLVLAMPHGGTWLPDDVAGALNATGRMLSDTDWHIARLYEGLAPGASVVRATVHRYGVDANRDPAGASLYPGQATTGLVPETDFDGTPIWDTPPDAAEVARRVTLWHVPYHAALQAELARVRAAHGVAVLWDCHSIRSVIPRLFPGRLPDLNIGTDGGRTCAPGLQAAVERVCHEAKGFTTTTNGRFRGGWTTRHTGTPGAGVHALQMEVAQRTYMAESPPWTYDTDAAARLRPILGACLAALMEAVR